MVILAPSMRKIFMDVIIIYHPRTSSASFTLILDAYISTIFSTSNLNISKDKKSILLIKGNASFYLSR
jgi:hypothetical protein